MTGIITIRIALRALIRNKTRSLLTALGIIIGIAAVIAVVAVGQGASVTMRNQINSMGNNLVMIFPGSQKAGGFHGGSGTQQTLTAEDGDAILEECPFVAAMTPSVRSGAQCVYKENNWATSIQGVGIQYQTVRNWDLDSGSFFNEGDVRSASRVCVIGKTVASQLFQDEDPVARPSASATCLSASWASCPPREARPGARIRTTPSSPPGPRCGGFSRTPPLTMSASS